MQPIQFFAARAEDGALLPGATVDVFVQGIQGRAPLFADSPCTVPLGNPVSADANARVFFYTTTPCIDMRISRYGYVAPLIVDISTWDAATAVGWVQAEIDAALGEIGDSLAEMEGEFVADQTVFRKRSEYWSRGPIRRFGSGSGMSLSRRAIAPPGNGGLLHRLV